MTTITPKMARVAASRRAKSPELHREHSANQGPRSDGNGTQSPKQATSLPPTGSFLSVPELSDGDMFPKINSGYELTFGVELEMVYAFHHRLLKDVLDRDPVTEGIQIHKSLPWDLRRQLNQTTHNYGGPQRVYMGWALGWESDSPSARFIKTRRLPGILNDVVSTYGIEPLKIAADILLSACDPNVQVHEGEDKHLDYSEWHLTNDRSITGVDGSTLLSRLADRITPENLKYCMFSMTDNRYERHVTNQQRVRGFAWYGARLSCSAV